MTFDDAVCTKQDNKDVVLTEVYYYTYLKIGQRASVFLFPSFDSLSAIEEDANIMMSIFYKYFTLLFDLPVK